MDYFAGDMPRKSAKTPIALSGGIQTHIFRNQEDEGSEEFILKWSEKTSKL